MSRERSLVFERAKVYSRNGFGFGGSLLKHSLAPLSLLAEVLPARGRLIDIGCGEGMLANLTASRLPGLRIEGIDKDESRIAAARRCAAPNAGFEHGDFLDAEMEAGAEAVVINDVLHHHPDERQKAILSKAADLLADGGVLVLKEVDDLDSGDRGWTSFWDTRLYPDDILNFHDVETWRKLLSAHGFRVLRVERVSHPWPASRTVFVCRRRARVPKASRTPGEKKVLLTGGTGFIGAQVARELLASGIDGKTAEVILLARDPARVPEDLESSCRVLEGSLGDLPSKSSELADVEYVFHLAADKDFFGGERIYESNMKGLNSLIEAFKGSESLKRIVFASSLGAVDRAANDDCSKPLGESAPCHATTPYGRSKYDGEKRLAESGLPYTAVRIPWCYGPGMTPITHVRKLTEMVMRGSPAARFDWPGRVSLIDVKQCAEAFVFAAARPDTENGTFFVSDGEPIRFGDLFREMGRLTGSRAATLPVPGIAVFFARLFRGLLPFTLRSLFLDVMTVDDAKLRGLDFKASGRKDLFLLPLVRFINDELRPGRRFSTAIVTGAASGIGRAAAAQLSGSGRGVVIADQKGAEEAAAALPGAEPLEADLSTTEGRAKVAERLSRGDADLLFNCAGVGLRSDVGDSDPGKVARMLGVNVRALTELSEAAMKAFRSAGNGVLINMASSAALQPLPGMAAYAASKAYVLSFSEALSLERPAPGVTVLTVVPGGTDTRFQASAGVAKDPGEKLLSPDCVATAVLRAAAEGRSRTLFVGSRPLMQSLVARVLPRSTNLALWKGLMDKLR